MHPGENRARWLCLIIIVLIFTVGTLRGEEHPSESPIQVSVSDLGRDPQKFDGRLVRVQALLVFGWEGDNFLSDPDPQNIGSRGPAYLWFHCKRENEQQVYGPIRPDVRRTVRGWFTGFFHFVPTHKANGVFDPGPLQFEAIEVSIPEPQPLSLAGAIRQGNLEEARKIVRSGAKLNILDEYQSFPLSEASKLGNADFVEELLKAGADPNVAVPGGDTALQQAAWNCKVGVAKVLLAHGAAVNAADAAGETPLILSSQACTNGEMTQVLLSAGADPNAKTDNDVTALMAAARNPLVAERLIKAGADPGVKDKYGNTVENDSCERGAEGFYRVYQLVRKALGKPLGGPGSCN